MGPWQAASKPRSVRWGSIMMPCGAGRGGTRQLTLALWALALLTVRRAGALAVEAFNKRVAPAQEMSPLAAFKASHGLPSR